MDDTRTEKCKPAYNNEAQYGSDGTPNLIRVLIARTDVERTPHQLGDLPTHLDKAYAQTDCSKGFANTLCFVSNFCHFGYFPAIFAKWKQD